ncbi:MAG: phosphotransferase family protein [Bacteroidia bacterium]|nr:phosphotransferase family protein [Bacteroidia bacterium]
MQMASEWYDKPGPLRKGEKPDTAGLNDYLTSNLPGWKGLSDIHQFPSGYSNLTYLISSGDQDYVLRRPPYGANVKSGHDMSREFRILSALIAVYPKVPRPVLFCENPEVVGAPFYLMERVRGVILRSQMSVEMYPPPPLMANIATSLAESLAELHRVDYAAAGLSEWGKPEGYVARQVKGWTDRYFKAKTDEVPEIENAARWLAENMPAESAASLIHNDFKYDNVVLNPDNRAEVMAILDWEMATIGDPLMDLGTSLGYWTDPDDPPEILALQLSPTTLPGNPSRSEMAELYAKKSGRDVGQILFYYVYGLFKVAVIVQQIYWRYRMGHTGDTRFANLIHAVRGCGRMASQAIAKQRIDRLF